MARDPKPHSFSPAIATEHGVIAAVLINHLSFWIEHNRANKVNFHDERWWTYNSLKAFEKQFPYLTLKQIRGALEKLVEKNVLLTGHFHENKYDRRTWYAFADETRYLDLEPVATDLPSGANGHAVKGKSVCRQGQMDSLTRANGLAPEGKSLVNTDVNTDVNQMVPTREQHIELQLSAARRAPRRLS
ncbi:hypothetical protein [Paraburkholderia acidiphila]|uniref:Uncharacterized protein n=1 Tax=Paraburkholderia acidiphila TaxID=2571747 RepID=A0A7Z2G4Q8_9BURK|nr:hypothetical protein [Paraburkholderia acidiphila]QGZ55110.1 hypothetical protein FAZ97_09365 [Paraburkholderia acidiphila]